MTVANFEQLCADLCAVAAVDTPALIQDEWGITAISFEIDGTTISVMQHSDAAETVVIACKLGVVPQDQDHLACRLLMESNFLMIGQASSPCIGRNPATGEFVLHYSKSLDGASGVDLYQAILRMSAFARRWSDRLAAAAPKSQRPESMLGMA